MAFKYVVIAVVVVVSGMVAANPANKPAFWKGTPMDGMVEEMRSLCSSENDSVACTKFKIMNFLDTIFKKDNFQISNDVEVRSNGAVTNDARGATGVLDQVENYLRSHDVTFKMPIADAKVTVSQRNLQNDEMSVTFNFPSSSTGRSAVEARKSKLKKIVIPIMVFILLKAMTLIPMALGVLGLKAWNSLQLSFFSFVVSVGLAIFQLCKKLAADSHHPHIAAHGPWDAGRSFANVEQPAYEGQDMAYNAYA
ncbi:osiris 19 [Anopheles darlingi]|uniref:Osiris 19 n=1 Tax=Anopheles darlingi TaxID=43151 RepID=W5JI21_ANODA|nr:osiris 19 [Anopheles darlingi]